MVEVKEDMTEKREKSKIALNFLKKIFTTKIGWIGIIICMIIVGFIGFGDSLFLKNKSTKLGFEDIGELATQTAYCTEINTVENSKELYGVKIPFTQSKYIYTCDVTIKAGFNFEEIEWKENGTSIEVKLPEASILSSDIDLSSFKIYHEDNNIFTPIDLKENNENLIKLKESAEKTAVENGLIENARANVEEILKGFFSKEYDLEKYEVVFKDK